MSIQKKVWLRRIAPAALAMGLALGSGVAVAQMGTDHSGATAQDKQYLHDAAQDSNYEIKTSQLALKKSNSADVKEYARMVIHDHSSLKAETKVAERAAKVPTLPPSSMSSSDEAKLNKLQGLSGNDFDKEYIQGLLKGNEGSVSKSKSEASEASLPAIKKLAGRQAEIDAKHADDAKKLAQAHNVTAEG